MTYLSTEPRQGDCSADSAEAQAAPALRPDQVQLLHDINELERLRNLLDLPRRRRYHLECASQMAEAIGCTVSEVRAIENALRPSCPYFGDYLTIMRRKLGLEVQ